VVAGVCPAFVDCSDPPGSLPIRDARRNGPEPSIPLNSVVVIMQENHSFD